MEEFHEFEITPRQKEALKVIARITEEKGGTGPTYKELAKAMRITEQAAVQMAERLTARGRLRWVPRSARTLRVVEEGPAA